MSTLASMVEKLLEKNSKKNKSKKKESTHKYAIMSIPASKPKTNKKKRSHKNSMGKRKGKSKSHKSSGFSGVKGSLNGIVRKVSPYALALGTGTIAVLALSKVQPNASMQTAQIVSAGAAYMAGGFEGLIGSEIIKAIAGAPSLLSGVLGGAGMGSNQAQNSSGWL